MYFPETFPNVRFKIWNAVLFIFVVQVASASQCFSSANITCDCDNAKVECSGVQTHISEIQDILANFTSISDIIIKIMNLQFEPGFKLYRNMSVTNLTLGYGLQTVPFEFFLELGSSLISLNLQNNRIKQIDDRLFSSLDSLKELFLDMNELKELESSMFAKLVNLNYLTIASNNFHEVAPDTFQNLFSLQTLVLSHNNLSLFKNVNIKSSNLSVLKLDSCEIQGLLENDTFSELLNLEELDLAYNKLSEVKPNSLSALKNLRYLNLSHNVIEFLQENAFMELNNLTHLDLKSNKISMIRKTSFANLWNLEYLDLRGNKLKVFPCEYTTDFAHLETIYLQNNEIKSVTTGAFYYSPLLKKLDITGNDLECSCELIDMYLYLIANPTMKKADFDLVFCNETSTLANRSITSFTNSKCISQEPCKLLNDDYDYSDRSENETTDDITSTTPITSSTALLTFIGSTSKTSTETTTDSPVTSTAITSGFSVTSTGTTTDSPVTTTDSPITSVGTTTDSLITSTVTTTDSPITSPVTSAGTTTDSPITSAGTTTDSPITSAGTTTDSPISTEITTDSPITSTIFASSTLDNDTALPTTSSPTSTISTNTSTDSPIMSTSAVTSLIALSISDNDTFTDPETTTVLLTTLKKISGSIITTTEVNSLSDSTTFSMPNDNLTTLYFTAGSVSNSGSQTSTVVENTIDFYSTINSGIVNETTTTTNSATSSVTYSTTEMPPTISEKISTVAILTPKQNCSSLELSLESLTSDPKVIVISNFSYDDNTFCLKWMIRKDLPPKRRCILKYTFIKGIKSANLKCPSFPGEVKLWTIKEKIFNFCIDIYVDTKISSCVKIFEKTIPSNFNQTIANMTHLKTNISKATFSTDSSTQSSRFIYTDTSTRATTYSTDSYNKTFTSTVTSTVVPSSVPSVSTTDETTVFKTDAISTNFTAVSYPIGFNVTSFDVFFNDSIFAYVKWTVSKEEQLNLCNLTLTATSQNSVHKEGVFPCENRTHKLENVKEGEVFETCLVSHDSSGYHTICKYSLGNANFDAEASKSKDHSTSNHNSSLIPLSCLLILLVLIVIFIIFKNLYRKKLESDRYDVRGEEEKSERVEVRPASSHDRSSVRYSYIAKENPDN